MCQLYCDSNKDVLHTANVRQVCQLFWILFEERIYKKIQNTN